MTDNEIEQELQAKGKTAARVTPNHIESIIASEHYFTASDGVQGDYAKKAERYSPIPVPEPLCLLTFCVLELDNGFTVTGESACASPENFDPEMGRKLSRANAVRKIWALEGYLLRQKLHEQAPQQGNAGSTVDDDALANGTLQPHQLRVVTELDEVKDRYDKLVTFIGGDVFSALPEQEQRSLEAQSHIMLAYVEVLTQRTKRFYSGTDGDQPVA